MDLFLARTLSVNTYRAQRSNNGILSPCAASISLEDRIGEDFERNYVVQREPAARGIAERVDEDSNRSAGGCGSYVC